MRRIAILAVLAATLAGPATAQQGYVGQILLVGFNFCPRGTMPANGQLLPINQYTALFALYGTSYGGDGRTTFGLPDLRGRSAVAFGQAPGLANLQIGTKAGAEQVTITTNQMPSHNHGVTAQLNGVVTPGSSPSPAGAMSALSTTASIYGTGSPTAMAGQAITVNQNNVGGGQPLPIQSPIQALNYCVVIDGIFPTRN